MSYDAFFFFGLLVYSHHSIWIVDAIMYFLCFSLSLFFFFFGCRYRYHYILGLAESNWCVLGFCTWGSFLRVTIPFGFANVLCLYGVIFFDIKWGFWCEGGFFVLVRIRERCRESVLSLQPWRACYNFWVDGLVRRDLARRRQFDILARGCIAAR
jgi:hypothetical protein